MGGVPLRLDAVFTFVPPPDALGDGPRLGYEGLALGNHCRERQVGGGAPVAKTRLGASQATRRFLQDLRSVQVCVTLVYGCVSRTAGSLL